jgi:hypothetical protein
MRRIVCLSAGGFPVCFVDFGSFFLARIDRNSPDTGGSDRSPPILDGDDDGGVDVLFAGASLSFISDDAGAGALCCGRRLLTTRSFRFFIHSLNASDEDPDWERF